MFRYSTLVITRNKDAILVTYQFLSQIEWNEAGGSDNRVCFNESGMPESKSTMGVEEAESRELGFS